MAMSLLSPLSMLLILFLLTPARSSPIGFRLDLTHVDASRNYTKLELLHRATLRSRHRTQSITKARVSVFASEGEYLLDLAIGTPTRTFTAILDTGSDLIWTQCKPCHQCFPQPTPLFDPTRSSSYSNLQCSNKLCQALPPTSCKPDCNYSYGYGDNSSTDGVLATETFTFGSHTTARLGFGCGTLNQGDFSNASGLVGFGRGPLSLISQLGVNKFSYCFTSFGESKKSPLLFGSHSRLNHHHHHHAHVRSTPLLKNPWPSQSTFYYISLQGITVGATRLPIPKGTFSMKEDGSGGVIIDSGTTVTLLETSAYNLMKKAFLHQVKLPLGNASSEGFDLCFSLPSSSSPAASVEVPKLVFHFEGADMELTRENYMVEDSGLMCLTIFGSDGMSTFGNLQQQNMHVQYDLKKEKLSFVPAQCDRL